MKIITDIFIESSEIFTVVAGGLGIGLFIVMIITLDILRALGKVFNRPYSVKQMEKTVDKRKDIEKLLYRQSKVLGIIIVISSVYVFLFLFYKLDLEKILSLLKVKSAMQPFTLALLQTAKLFSIFSMILAFIFGIILFVDKSSAEKISDIFSTWYSTEELEDKLDETIFKDTDTICFLHNKFIGFLGLVASVILFGLAVANLVS